MSVVFKEELLKIEEKERKRKKEREEEKRTK
jgi:hypothetical protein